MRNSLKKNKNKTQKAIYFCIYSHVVSHLHRNNRHKERRRNFYHSPPHCSCSDYKNQIAM